MKTKALPYSHPVTDPARQQYPALPQEVIYMPEKDEGTPIKEVLLYTVLGVAVIGGAIWAGRKLYREIVSGAEERKSQDTESEAAYAKRIRMAFDNDGWWGTDEEALRQLLREIKNQSQWDAIARSYQRLYANPIMRDMESELTSTQYAEMSAIIAAKPGGDGAVSWSQYYDNWARRLKAAFEDSNWVFPGTDEDAVKAVFLEIPSQAAFVQVTIAYASLTGHNFLDDLKDEMWDWADYMKIITSKPQ